MMHITVTRCLVALVVMIATISAPAHAGQIRTRTVDGVGRFYDSETGEAFVPRGSNYIRYGPVPGTCEDPVDRSHRTFDPDFYSPCAANAALRRMHADGFNVVRVFLDKLCIGDPEGDGLWGQYLKNLADFLWRAHQTHVFVLLVLDDLPGRDYQESYGMPSRIADVNRRYLTAAGLAAERRFWSDLINGLREIGAPLSQIFAYELVNEQYCVCSHPPLDGSDGFIDTPTGSYNLSLIEDRNRMLDENLVHFVNETRQAIREIDAQALVTIGFFPPQWPCGRPGATDVRVVRPAGVMVTSDADFLDLHLYPGCQVSVADFMGEFAIGDARGKPLLMGEFGAFKQSYPDISAAAQAMINWQVESCSYGFAGWLTWTWDDENDEPGSRLWREMSNCGWLNGVMAPRVRPDPCLAGGLVFPALPENLAHGKPVTASLSNQYLAEKAVDNCGATSWGAGDYPPHWIEVDLEAPSDIRWIRLLAGGTDGPTTHTIWGKTASEEPYLQLTEFSSDVGLPHGMVLEQNGSWPGIRFVKVQIDGARPGEPLASWVSLYELGLYAALTVVTPPLWEKPDDDADGVCNSDDRCSGFDDHVDSDSDGVPDRCDDQPGMDDRVDTDGDTVPDLCDRCPGAADWSRCDRSGGHGWDYWAWLTLSVALAAAFIFKYWWHPYPLGSVPPEA